MLQTGISEVDQRVSICPLGTIDKNREKAIALLSLTFRSVNNLQTGYKPPALSPARNLLGLLIPYLIRRRRLDWQVLECI